jgi:hypothetical protein
MNPVFLGDSVFREVQIVNGNVVKDVELSRTVDDKKEVIEGHVNNVPVEITRTLKKMKRKRSSKKTDKGASKKKGTKGIKGTKEKKGKKGTKGTKGKKARKTKSTKK